MQTPARLKDLEHSINEDLSKANLPEVRISSFKLPEQALELTFERDTATGVIRDKIWEIINSHYKRLMSELGLLEGLTSRRGTFVCAQKQKLLGRVVFNRNR